MISWAYRELQKVNNNLWWVELRYQDYCWQVQLALYDIMTMEHSQLHLVNCDKGTVILHDLCVKYMYVPIMYIQASHHIWGGVIIIMVQVQQEDDKQKEKKQAD